MALTWLRVVTASPSEELTGLLAEALVECGGMAIEEQNGSLVTYIPLPDHADSGAPDIDQVIASIRATLRDVLGTEPTQFAAEQVPEQDWLALWRSGLAPRRVGAGIIVSPTWSEVEPDPGDVVIRIDPEMAFGTGEHASTRGVLRLLQQIDVRGARLLDVGSGSGILAIAGALLGASHVVAAESDPEAIPNASANIDRSGAAERIELLCAIVDDAFLAVHGAAAFDGILANVLSGVLRPLLPAFQRALAGNGWAILSGILVEEAPDMRAAAASAGFIVAAEDVEEQWWSVLLRRA